VLEYNGSLVLDVIVKLNPGRTAPDQARELCLPDLNRVASQVSAVNFNKS
jgi:hypothetical protein